MKIGLLPKYWLERRHLWVNVGVGRSSGEVSQAMLPFHKLKKLEWGWGVHNIYTHTYIYINGNGRNHL